MRTPRRTSRGAVRGTAVGALATLLLVTCPPTPAGAEPDAGASGSAAPSPSPSAAPSGVTPDVPVEVSVTTLAPRFLSDPDQTLQIAGTLTNTGSTALTTVRLALLVGDRLRSRSELAEADLEQPPLFVTVDELRAEAEDLGPGESTRFTVSMRVGRLGLGRIGVYPLGVRVRAGVEDGRDTVGLVTTYLPWFPDGPPAPTRVAWVWPLVDEPRRAPRELMVDDALAEAVGAGGRLSQLVIGAAAGGEGSCDRVPAPLDGPAPPTAPCVPVPVPVTYAVDPDLLFSLQAMTERYDVLERGARSPRPASTDAASWLRSLRTELALDRTSLLVLPYADPDPVAVVRHESLRDDVGAAVKLGTQVVEDVVGPTGTVDVAMPPAGPVTQAALRALLGARTAAVVLDETALPPRPGATLTADTRAALSTDVRSEVTGLVVDAGLSALLEPGPATSGKGPRLAEQRWLVESAMVVAEAPARSRTLVVSPPRRGTVPQAVASNVLADTGRVPWLCPVPLADVVAGVETCPGTPPPAQPREAVERGALGDADPSLVALVADDHLREVARVRRAADQFTDRVLDPSADATTTKQRLLRARLRAESSAFRGDRPGGPSARLLTLLREDVTSLRDQVTVRVGGKVTLTSDSGTIRVNLQNELDQQATVRVQLTAPNARLSVKTTPEVVVPPRKVVQVDVEVEALVSGQFVVEAQLLDREQQPYGPSQRLVVRSTRYGRVALAVTGLGAAVLLIAAGVRITRRALRRPGEPADPAAPAS